MSCAKRSSGKSGLIDTIEASSATAVSTAANVDGRLRTKHPDARSR